jgi:type IV fimbrial biogenesis protein FimT
LLHFLHAPRRQRGLTLIEACVAFALVAILAAIAAPSMGDLVDGRRFDFVVAQLGTDVQFARSEAVSRNQTLRLSFYAKTDGACYVIHLGPSDLCDCKSAAANGPAECAPGAIEIKTVRLPAVHRVTLRANVSSLGFEPLHGLASPAGTLCISGPNGRRVNKVVSMVGRVRSCTPPPTATTCVSCLSAT